MIVKAEGPSGPAKIYSDNPKHALGLAQYLRTIGYNAWIEDTNGNEIDEKALKMAIRSSRGCNLLLMQLGAFPGAIRLRL
jgi:hypothetical protein